MGHLCDGSSAKAVDENRVSGPWIGFTRPRDWINNAIDDGVTDTMWKPRE